MKIYRCAGRKMHPWGYRDGPRLHVYGTPKEKVGKKSGLKVWEIPQPKSWRSLFWRGPTAPGFPLTQPLRKQQWRKTEYVLSLPARCKCWGCGDIHTVPPARTEGGYYGQVVQQSD